jgi:hypothetical protein
MKKIFTLLSLLISLAGIAQFTPGNVVVVRVGTGAGSLANTGNAVFLDEFTPAGTLVQSVALPTTVVGANKRLVLSGTSTSEGMIQLSPNGQYLALAGYDSDVPAASSLTASASATVNRTVAIIDQAENINTSTALTDFSTGSSPRAAITTNGTNIWVAGGAGGVRYTTLGSTTSTQLSTTVTNMRTLNIANNQLYTSTGSGSIRVATVGTGLPTAAGETITNLPGFPTTGSPYQFVLLDMDAGVAGPDVLYVADDAAGIQKYSLVGGNWTLNGTMGTGADTYRGLTGKVIAGPAVQLYSARKGGSSATGGGELVSVLDASGYNTAPVSTITLMSTAAANTAYRGVAFTPGSILPLNLLSFGASLSDNKVTVNWTTANEVNVAGYEIERSVNGKDFMPISLVQAENAGATKQYSYIDPRAVAGMSYYRLKMKDNDGSYKYSQIATIKNSMVGVSLYPNPVRSAVTIQHESADKGATVSIVGMNGKQLITMNVQPGAVQTTIEAGKLAPGAYMVIYTNNGMKQTKQFIKE